MNRETFEELIPAYALGALDADELAEFEAFLADDPEAQRLVAEFQAITDQLVLTTPARPAPAHLQNDLRHRLAAQNVSDTHQVTLIDSARRDAAQPQNLTKAHVLPMPALIGLAAVLAVVIGAALILTRGQQPSSARDIFDQLAGKPDTVRVALAPQPGYENVDGELATDGEQAVICMNGMPAISADQAFQLWFAYAEGGLQGSDTFQSTQSDETCVIVPVEEANADYQAFAVSIEPSTGSPRNDQPSGEVVFVVPVVQ